jgi:hypothetical protein
MAVLVVKAVHENDPTLVCFMFTHDGERTFSEAADTTTCPATINALHERIAGKGYGNATVAPDKITRETDERPATVSGCTSWTVHWSTTSHPALTPPICPEPWHQRLTNAAPSQAW